MDGARMVTSDKIMLTAADVALFVSGGGGPLNSSGTVVLCVGDVAAVMSAGEWSRLIRDPKHADIVHPEAGE